MNLVILAGARRQDHASRPAIGRPRPGWGLRPALRPLLVPVIFHTERAGFTSPCPLLRAPGLALFPGASPPGKETPLR